MLPNKAQQIAGEKRTNHTVLGSTTFSLVATSPN